MHTHAPLNEGVGSEVEDLLCKSHLLALFIKILHMSTKNCLQTNSILIWRIALES